MITFYPQTESFPNQIIFTDELKERLVNVIKRGSNTLSPPDMEIIRLISDLEDMKK